MTCLQTFTSLDQSSSLMLFHQTTLPVTYRVGDIKRMVEPEENVGRVASILCHLHSPTVPLLSYFSFFSPFCYKTSSLFSFQLLVCFSFFLILFLHSFFTFLSLPIILAVNSFLYCSLSVSSLGVHSYNFNQFAPCFLVPFTMAASGHTSE